MPRSAGERPSGQTAQGVFGKARPHEHLSMPGCPSSRTARWITSRSSVTCHTCHVFSSVTFALPPGAVLVGLGDPPGTGFIAVQITRSRPALLAADPLGVFAGLLAAGRQLPVAPGQPPL